MYKMTTMYTYLVYPLDIFGSPNNYVKVKMVQTCSQGNIKTKLSLKKAPVNVDNKIEPETIETREKS